MLRGVVANAVSLNTFAVGTQNSSTLRRLANFIRHVLETPPYFCETAHQSTGTASQAAGSGKKDRGLLITSLVATSYWKLQAQALSRKRVRHSLLAAVFSPGVNDRRNCQRYIDLPTFAKLEPHLHPYLQTIRTTWPRLGRSNVKTRWS